MGIKKRIQSLTIKQISLIMLFATLFLPTANLQGPTSVQANEYIMGVRVTALIWAMDISYWIINSQVGISITGFSILDPDPFWMLITLIYSAFDVVFAIQVVRFCRNQTSKRLALLAGVLTIVFPMIFNPYGAYLGIQDMIDFIMRSGLLLYIGPLPIQLIIGLVIMRYAGPWKLTKPWQEEEDLED